MSGFRGSWPRRWVRNLRTAWFRPLLAGFDDLAREIGAIRLEIHRMHLDVVALRAEQARAAPTLRGAEFGAFSQFGEDGIIQWLLARVPVVDRSFVEFGVEDYTEANTRLLLEQGGWRGLILDGGAAHIERVRRDGLAWRTLVDARQAFVTAENIDALLAGQSPDLGLLSVDIDGMDYWVLSAITVVTPRIVVCEYNSLWGPEAAVSVPYRPDFDRRAAHPSNLYFGASIAALAHWGRAHGYRLVGGTSQGVNAFFVREDVAGTLPSLTGSEAWAETPIRQALDAGGRLTYLTGFTAQRAVIADLPLVDVVSGTTLRVSDLG